MSREIGIAIIILAIVILIIGAPIAWNANSEYQERQAFYRFLSNLGSSSSESHSSISSTVPIQKPSAAKTPAQTPIIQHAINDGYWCRITTDYVNNNPEPGKHCYKFYLNGSYEEYSSLTESVFGNGWRTNPKCDPQWNGDVYFADKYCVPDTWIINSQGQYQISSPVQSFTYYGNKLESTFNHELGPYLWTSQV